MEEQKERSVPVDGNRLRAAREQAGLSRPELLKRTGDVVSTDMLRKLETGKMHAVTDTLPSGKRVTKQTTRNTSAATLEALAEALKIRPEWLQGSGRIISLSDGKETGDYLSPQEEQASARRAETVLRLEQAAADLLRAAGYELRPIEPELDGTGTPGPSLEIERSDGATARVFPAALLLSVARAGLAAVDGLFPDPLPDTLSAITGLPEDLPMT